MNLILLLKPIQVFNPPNSSKDVLRTKWAKDYNLDTNYADALPVCNQSANPAGGLT
jgi:hypothetical protein